MEGEYKVSDNAHIRSKIGSDDVKDRSNERGVREKRKHPDRSTHDFDNEREKRRDKDSAIQDRDRNADRAGSVGRDRIVDIETSRGTETLSGTETSRGQKCGAGQKRREG